MRIIECRQGTEEWEAWRNRPTASQFGKFITPAKGDYSSTATSYAATIVAKRLGVYTEPPPSYWMEWGTENEPNARHAYRTTTGREVQEVGFVLPDHTDAFGGSPDGLVGDDGLLEIKCPAPETLIMYHATGTLPNQYRPQIQGLLMITGRAWCDLYVWHPELKPWCHRVYADPDYQSRIIDCLVKLLAEIEQIEQRVWKVRHEIVSVGTSRDQVRWD